MREELSIIFLTFSPFSSWINKLQEHILAVITHTNAFAYIFAIVNIKTSFIIRPLKCVATLYVRTWTPLQRLGAPHMHLSNTTVVVFADICHKLCIFSQSSVDFPNKNVNLCSLKVYITKQQLQQHTTQRSHKLNQPTLKATLHVIQLQEQLQQRNHQLKSN